MSYAENFELNEQGSVNSETSNYDSPNLQITLTDICKQDFAVLKWVIKNGRADILKYFQTIGLTPSDVLYNNKEALRLAAEKGHVDVLRVLKVDFGIEAKDARPIVDGRTYFSRPFQLAAENGHVMC